MTIESLLARDGMLVYRTRGVSMEPMLRQNRDLVVIQPLSRRLKKYDVALYRRGDDYVLHRGIRVESDLYLIRGDNTYTLEKVPEEAVLGVLTGFQRKGREYKTSDPIYQFYVRFWNTIYPMRSAYVRLRRRAVSMVRRTGLLP